MNQALAVRLLEKQGHSVTRTGSGRETLAVLEQSAFQGFDLVLMDVQMLALNGLDAAAAIRERERSTGRHVPIIAMTPHAVMGDRDRCLTVGMDGYISKPIRPAELPKALEGVAATNSKRASAEGAEPSQEPVCQSVSRGR